MKFKTGFVSERDENYPGWRKYAQKCFLNRHYDRFRLMWPRVRECDIIRKIDNMWYAMDDDGKFDYFLKLADGQAPEFMEDESASGPRLPRYRKNDDFPSIDVDKERFPRIAMEKEEIAKR